MAMRFRFNPEHPQVKGAQAGAQIAVGKNYYPVDAELSGDKLEPLTKPQGPFPALLIRNGGTASPPKQKYESLSEPAPPAGPPVTQAPPELLKPLTEAELQSALRRTGVNPQMANATIPAPPPTGPGGESDPLDGPDDGAIVDADDGEVDNALNELKAEIVKTDTLPSPSEVAVPADVSDLMERNTKKELVAQLEQKGLDTSGGKLELAQRLAASVAKE